MYTYGRLALFSLYGHYGDASDSIDDLIDWCADATAEHGWEEHGLASRTVARGHYKAMYRHEWAMKHCREKAEHLLLNIQHALPDPNMGCRRLHNNKRTVSAGPRTRVAVALRRQRTSAPAWARALARAPAAQRRWWSGGRGCVRTPLPPYS